MSSSETTQSFAAENDGETVSAIAAIAGHNTAENEPTLSSPAPAAPPPTNPEDNNVSLEGDTSNNIAAASHDDRKSPLSLVAFEAQRRELLNRVEAVLDGNDAVLTDHATLDGLDLLTDLLQKENSCLEASSSIADYALSTSYASRLTELVGIVCDKYQNQTRVWMKRVTAIRELLGQFYDLVESKLKHEGIAVRSFLEAMLVEDAVDGMEGESMAICRLADARLAVSRAATHVAHSEEQTAALERDAIEATNRALEVAKVAHEVERRIAEAAQAEEQKRRDEQEKAEREELERKLAEEKLLREQAEEEKRRIKEMRGQNESKPTEEEGEQENDLSTWPSFIYQVDPGDTGLAIGCVFRVSPNKLERDELQVQRIEQLDCSLTLGPGEELISNVIEIRPSGNVDDDRLIFDPPAAVAMPFISQRTLPSRESIVMVSNVTETSNAVWAETVTREVILDDLKEFKFVEFRLDSLQTTVRLAVVSRLKREMMSVSKKTLWACSSIDQRVTFTFNPENLTSRKATNFLLEVQPVDLLSVQEVKHRCPEVCERFIASSPIVRVESAVPKTAADDFKSPGLPPALARQPVVISFPVPPNPAKLRRPATSVTDGRLPPSSSGSGGRKNDTSAPSAGAGAKATGEQAKGRPKTAMFYGSAKANEIPEDTVCLLVKDEDDRSEKWTFMSNIKPVPLKNADVFGFELPKVVRGRMIAVRKLVGGAITDLEMAVKQLELGLQMTAITAVLRHDAGDPVAMSTRVNLHFVPPGSVSRTARKLAEDGYPNGPPVGTEYMLREGHRLTIRFRGNICAEDGSSELRAVYNSNIKSMLDFRVVVADKFAQKSIDIYRGFVQIYANIQSSDTSKSAALQREQSQSNVLFRQQSTVPKNAAAVAAEEAGKSNTLTKTMSRANGMTCNESNETLLWELLVTIPKLDGEDARMLITRAPAIIHTEGAVDIDLLRHLAREIGDEWRYLARLLGIRRIRLQAVLCIDNSGVSEEQQSVYEMLTSWVKKMPRAVNKTGLLRTALLNCGRPDLAEYVAARQREFSRRSACRSARGSSLRRAMVTVARHSDLLPDWISLCSALGLDQHDIEEIACRHQGLRDRCYESLVCWAQRENNDENKQKAERNVHGLVQVLRRARYSQLADIVYSECHSRG